MRANRLFCRAAFAFSALLASAAIAAGAAGARTKSRLTASDKTSVFGQAVTFTATVTATGAKGPAPVGQVTFEDVGSAFVLGTVSLDAAGTATLVVSNLPLGHRTVKASFTPTSGEGASDDSVKHRVELAGTSTALSSSAQPSVFGQPVTFTATVSPASAGSVPTGTVTFTIDGTHAGTVTLGSLGTASLTVSSLATGAHSIVASYTSDNGGYGASTSGPLAQRVDAAPTSVSLASSQNPSNEGAPVTFTAVVSAAPSAAVPTGTVTFLVDGVPAGVVTVDSSGQASLTTSSLGVGSHVVTASYASDSPNFTSSVSAPLTQSVTVRREYLAFGANVGSDVIVQDTATGATVLNFPAFPGFSGGVRVAVGDVNGDGTPDIIAGAGAGGNSHVRVFDGATTAVLHSFLAFSGVSGGVTVAAGDITGDGRADIIVGAPVNGHVKVFDGTNGALVQSFLAFGSFAGGVYVAAGDVNGDGRADIITGATANGHVKVFDGVSNSELHSFLAYPGYGGGVYVAAGDLDGDGRAEIITGADGTETSVKVFDSRTLALRASFIAFPGTPYGVRVAAADTDGDGRDDILATPTAPTPHVKVFDGATFTLLESFFAFPPAGFSIWLAGSR